jgi:hypothetical protein
MDAEALDPRTAAAAYLIAQQEPEAPAARVMSTDALSRFIWRVACHECGHLTLWIEAGFEAYARLTFRDGRLGGETMVVGIERADQATKLLCGVAGGVGEALHDCMELSVADSLDAMHAYMSPADCALANVPTYAADPDFADKPEAAAFREACLSVAALLRGRLKETWLGAAEGICETI